MHVLSCLYTSTHVYPYSHRALPPPFLPPPPLLQVGACIVNPENKIVGIGYNGMPNGCSDDNLPWNRKGEWIDTKYPYGKANPYPNPNPKVRLVLKVHAHGEWFTIMWAWFTIMWAWFNITKQTTAISYTTRLQYYCHMTHQKNHMM